MLPPGGSLLKNLAIICAFFIASQQFFKNRPIILLTVQTTTSSTTPTSTKSSLASASLGSTSLEQEPVQQQQPLQEEVEVDNNNNNNNVVTTASLEQVFPNVTTTTRSATTTRAAPSSPSSAQQVDPNNEDVTDTRNTGATTTTARTTTPPPSLHSSSPSMAETAAEVSATAANLSSQEKLFYQTHYEFMSAVPRDQYIMWEGRKRFRQFTNYFQQDIYVVPKDYPLDAAMSTTTPFVNNTDDKRIISFPHWLPGFCLAAKIMTRYRSQPNAQPWPHVTFLHFHEDTGGLTGTVSGKTFPRANIAAKWNKMGCSRTFLQKYLDHPDTLAVVASQHHVFDHPKAHSIPLGIRYDEQVNAAYNILHDHNASANFGRRPNWFMMSHNDGRDRPYSDRYTNTMSVLRAFKHLGLRNKIRTPQQYYRELSQSTFIYSPPGAGWDCYRTWEALVVGTIPIVEHLNRNDGMYRTYRDLPIAWIDSYKNLTPTWLEGEYSRIMADADSYRWEKLTKQYWYDWIISTFEKANVSIQTTTTTTKATTMESQQ